MKKLKQNKAITLIALVVTIIVLLILAGITLHLVIGENGLFSKARNAKNENNKATASETITLKITECQIKSYTENGNLPDLQYVADRFCEDNEISYVHLQKESTSAINEKITVGANTSIYTKLEKYPEYEFEINSSLQLASINGVQVANNDTTEYVSKAQYDSLLARVEALETANTNTTNGTNPVQIGHITNFKNGDYINLTSALSNYKYWYGVFKMKDTDYYMFSNINFNNVLSMSDDYTTYINFSEGNTWYLYMDVKIESSTKLLITDLGYQNTGGWSPDGDLWIYGCN